MTYKRAILIQTLIQDIDKSWNSSNYVAAIQRDEYTKGCWYVYLYLREGFPHQLIDLAVFARSLEGLACDIHLTLSEYDKATQGEDMVQAIKIW